MRSLEDRIRPPVLARAWPRDLLWLVLLAALAVVLLPLLDIDWTGAGTGGLESFRPGKGYGEQLAEITHSMASIYLPMAMGFLLCLRCGAIDVSLWVVSSLGGVVAALCIRGGMTPWLAMTLGVLSGAAAGSASGLLTALARVPSLMATFVTGMAILGVLHWTQPARQVTVPEPTFNNWHLPSVPARLAGPPKADQNAADANALPLEPPAAEPEFQPLSVTRSLLALGAYSLVMVVLMVADWFRPRSWGPGSRKRIFAAMAASGALAAAGGAISLLDAGKAVVSTRLVDDFTVPVAALLAGAAFLGGRGRTLLAAVFLPGALLLTVIWTREVLLYQWHGYSFQIVLLGLMVLLVQLAGADFTAGPGARSGWPLASCLLAIAGIILVGAGAGMRLAAGQWLLRIGLLVWILGAVALLVGRLRDRKAT